MNEQEYQQRRRQVLASIDGHVASRHSPVSQSALTLASRVAGVLMLSPAFLAGAWVGYRYWNSATAAAAAAPPSYLEAIVLFLLISLVASIALFFAITFASLRFAEAPLALSGFFGPFIIASRATARTMLSTFGLGTSITSVQAKRLAEFVASNPGAMGTVSSWAAKNPTLEFTAREVSCIDRVAKRLDALDAHWAKIQADITRRQEINALLVDAGIASSVSSLAQSASMSASTPILPPARDPSRF